MSGELPKSKDEIALDRMFAENNKIKIGDKIKIKNVNYKVSGLVALSDYCPHRKFHPEYSYFQPRQWN